MMFLDIDPTVVRSIEGMCCTGAATVVAVVALVLWFITKIHKENK